MPPSTVDDGDFTLPLEILDQIFDHLHQDKKATLSLGLVCKRTLLKSRLHHFSTLKFGRGSAARLDNFLGLMDVEWTSFTTVVNRIIFEGLFDKGPYNYTSNRRISRISRIARNLRYVRSIWITPCGPHISQWDYIPPHMMDLLLRLDIRDLRLYTVYFAVMFPIGIVDFFNTLRRLPGVDNLVLYGATGGGLHSIHSHFIDASIFRHPIRFGLLDSPSLEILWLVWEPLLGRGLNVTTRTFYFRALSWCQNEYFTFLSKFMNHVGSSVQRLCFELTDSFSHPPLLLSPIDSWSNYLEMDFSRCTNLHTVYIGAIHLEKNSADTKSMVQTMWGLLSLFPSPDCLQEISLGFRPDDYCPLADELDHLASFQWTDLISRLQHMFHNVKQIAIVTGTGDRKKAGLYLETLRGRCGLGMLEEEGVVKLDVVEMDPEERRLRAPWKEIAGF